MKSIVLGLVLLMVGCAGPAAKVSAPMPAPGIFFVATNGDDRWSGRVAAPNRARTDGPLATSSAALKAVREFRRQETNAVAKAVTVFLRSGPYFLSEPLVLGPEDSGLTLAAYPGEKPVLSGGRRITGWKEVTVESRKLWAAEVPEARDGKWVFRELWVN